MIARAVILALAFALVVALFARTPSGERRASCEREAGTVTCGWR